MSATQEDLLQRFVKHAEDHPELELSKRSLLAVSGGADSVVMAHLYAAAGFPFGIAHCNFQLRGEASDADADFVQQLADQLGAAFYQRSFPTEEVAEEEGVSLQMAARELRYEWLEEVRAEHGYRQIATGHHINDSLETSLLNFARGTGLRGLLGIPEKHEYIVRPLLIFTREEIEQYAQKQQIVFRLDDSNETDKYLRNRLRRKLVPILRELNPSIEHTFRKNVVRWTETLALREWGVNELGQRYTEQLGGKLRIDYRFMQGHPVAAKGLLFTWLKPYGFHPDQIRQALDASHHQSGAIWYAPEYRMLAGRKAFWIEKLPDIDPNLTVPISPTTRKVDLPDGSLKIHTMSKHPSREALEAANETYVDADRLSYPLVMRHWREGDEFCPLGMEGHHKKIQDFFTDKKINRFDKERIWILATAKQEIVWVVGYRLDERFKLTDQTKHILHLAFERK